MVMQKMQVLLEFHQLLTTLFCILKHIFTCFISASLQIPKFQWFWESRLLPKFPPNSYTVRKLVAGCFFTLSSDLKLKFNKLTALDYSRN